MSITPTYPGVYIQELPSSSHTITPAPTSIAAFVGFTHPLQTPRSSPQSTPANVLYSFADYQNFYGGFFSSPGLPDYVGQAVFQFFLNGGSQCYVVGLTNPTFPTPTATLGTVPAVTLNAIVPVGDPTTGLTGLGLPLQVTISNIQSVSSANDTADITIVYGPPVGQTSGAQVEIYRKVQISQLQKALAGSSLVSWGSPEWPPVSSPPTSLSYPAAGSPPSSSPLSYAFSSAPPSPPVSSFLDTQLIGEAFTNNYPLDKVPIFNLLAVPGISDPSVLAEATAYAERKRAFLIADPPSTWWVDSASTGTDPSSPIDGLSLLPVPVTANGGLYFPWLSTTDPVTTLPSTAPPSGFVAGMFAAEDANRGVWKAPAGLETALNGTTGVVPTGLMSDDQQGALNQYGINCIRQFPSLPPVIFGARTLAYRDEALQNQWGYVPVRRMALFIEQSLYANLTWAVFEPNDTPLWNALTQEVGAFMLGLFRQGAFAGTTPSQAFLVQCDSTTTTPADIANGVVNILVGFAPLRPAEFVVVQITQLAGQASS
ncbi:MAG TPA: phage tail sheath subtilisin-like domain-containing protein [Acidimicrobiales bacterium]|nr:phage tail sheath subtilisin-like domain-containing protein [Acidimicrobiales bacterium]